MFEPYVKELKYETPGIIQNFYTIPFDKRQNKNKYSCFILMAALHHIQNPSEVMK